MAPPSQELEPPANQGRFSQVFPYDLIVEPQTKQASRVAWTFKLDDDPLD
jgi:hypothetical protein